MTFVQEFKTFVKNTICGQESGLYKSLYLYKIDTGIDNIRSDATKILLQYAIVDYLNCCYKSLILKDDDYVVNSFAKMKKEKHHSEICLLNIMFAVIRSAFLEVDRHKFNDMTYNEFMDSVKKIYSEYLDDIDYDKLLNHECSGIKIEECNPNEQLFFIKS